MPHRELTFAAAIPDQSGQLARNVSNWRFSNMPLARAVVDIGG
jgi:hypothetical protein